MHGKKIGDQESEMAMVLIMNVEEANSLSKGKDFGPVSSDFL